MVLNRDRAGNLSGHPIDPQEVKPKTYWTERRQFAEAILSRCREILTAAERKSVAVKTYHSFCLELRESHGRLLQGPPARFLYPGEDRQGIS